MKGGIWPFTPKQPASGDVSNDQAPQPKQPDSSKSALDTRLNADNKIKLARAASLGAIGLAVSTAALGNSVAKLPVVGGAIAAVILIAAAAYKTNANLALQRDLIARVERKLIFAYYQFKILERATEIFNQKNSNQEDKLSIDTSRLTEAIAAVQIVMVNTVGTPEQQKENKEKSGRFSRLWRGFKAMATRDIEIEMKQVNVEVDILQDELIRLFMVFTTNVSEPIKYLKSTNTDVDKELIDRYKGVTDDKTGKIAADFAEFKNYLDKQTEEEKRAAEAGATGTPSTAAQENEAVMQKADEPDADGRPYSYLGSVEKTGRLGGHRKTRKSRRRRSRKGKTFRRKKQ